MTLPPITTYGAGLRIGDYFMPAKPNFVEGHRLEVARTNDGRIVCASPELRKSYAEVDISWLPFCAEKYQISPEISDYVLIDVPIVVADYPNRNMDAFTYKELTDWRTAIGRTAYQTFVGKPVHQDHDNQVDDRAKGVILDATFIEFQGQPHVKILKAFCRQKDERLAKLVQERNRVGHSMGALVERTECGLPWCKFISDGRVTCDHIKKGAGKGDIVRGHLVYEKMLDFYFIESSSVEDPAYVVAVTDNVF